MVPWMAFSKSNTSPIVDEELELPRESRVILAQQRSVYVYCSRLNSHLFRLKSPNDINHLFARLLQPTHVIPLSPPLRTHWNSSFPWPFFRRPWWLRLNLSAPPCGVSDNNRNEFKLKLHSSVKLSTLIYCIDHSVNKVVPLQFHYFCLQWQWPNQNVHKKDTF